MGCALPDQLHRQTDCRHARTVFVTSGRCALAVGIVLQIITLCCTLCYIVFGRSGCGDENSLFFVHFSLDNSV